MGRTHVAALTATVGVEVSWACDSDASRAEAVAREFGIAHWTTDCAELLAGEVEAVVVATTESAHVVPAVQALQAGKHVLVEKPLATSTEDARHIVEVARGRDLVLLVGLNLRFEPRYRMVKDWLESRGHSAVVSMQLRRNRPADLFAQYKRVHPAFETGIHDVDLMLWYSNSRASKVYATERRYQGDHNPFGVWAIVELECGTVVMLETVWLIPEAARVARGDALELYTENEVVHLDIVDNGIEFWQVDGRVRGDPILDGNSLSSTSLAIRNEINHFVDCIRNGKASTVVPLEQALHGIEVAHAIVESARRGRPVQL
jgi:UDP-N-acetylglucosamine 3-dehydrogenase